MCVVHAIQLLMKNKGGMKKKHLRRHLQENVKRTEINEHLKWKQLDLFLIINIGSKHGKKSDC